MVLLISLKFLNFSNYLHHLDRKTGAIIIVNKNSVERFRIFRKSKFAEYLGRENLTVILRNILIKPNSYINCLLQIFNLIFGNQ